MPKQTNFAVIMVIVPIVLMSIASLSPVVFLSYVVNIHMVQIVYIVYKINGVHTLILVHKTKIQPKIVKQH